MSLKFEWNKKKAKVNLINHKISFEEAKTVFGDALARISEDTAHSQYEQGWHIIGTSEQDRVIIVAYTEINNFIRIITSRKATPSERKDYEKNIF